MGLFTMPGIERRPVLRGFQHPDHENGATLLFDPAGRTDGNPAKEPCSVFAGAIPDDCRWWVEDVPDFEFTNGNGQVIKRHLRVGGDGAGPLLGPLLGEPMDAPPPSETVKTKPAGTDTQES